MARLAAALQVFYDDQTEATIPIKPVSLVAAERHFKGDIPMIEGTLWAAWHSAKKPMNNFDAWVSKIVDMAELDLNAKADESEQSANTDGTESPEVSPAE